MKSTRIYFVSLNRNIHPRYLEFARELGHQIWHFDQIRGGALFEKFDVESAGFDDRLTAEHAALNLGMLLKEQEMQYGFKTLLMFESKEVHASKFELFDVVNGISAIADGIQNLVKFSEEHVRHYEATSVPGFYLSGQRGLKHTWWRGLEFKGHLPNKFMLEVEEMVQGAQSTSPKFQKSLLKKVTDYSFRLSKENIVHYRGKEFWREYDVAHEVPKVTNKVLLVDNTYQKDANSYDPLIVTNKNGFFPARTFFKESDGGYGPSDWGVEARKAMYYTRIIIDLIKTNIPAAPASLNVNA